MSHFHPHSIDANNLHPSEIFIKMPSEATVRRYILQNMCSKKFCKYTGISHENTCAGVSF